MACFATPYGLRYAAHCFNRAHAQQRGSALIPAGGKLGVTSVGARLIELLARHNSVINLSRTAPRTSAAIEHLPTDLSNSRDVSNALKQILTRHRSGIDGLVNCAAVQFTPRLTDSDFQTESISKEITVNLTSPIQLIAGLLGALSQRRGAFILNVNSGLAIAPKSESAVYCATKAGLDNFSRGLRAQLRGTNVLVQQAFLPLVDTPMTAGRGTGKLDPNNVAMRIIDQIERGRPDLDIGKTGLLRTINRLSPALAHRIMQKGTA